MLSSNKTRSSGGCWTCRLRRKKCDEIRPVCGGCGALEIDCVYSDGRPEWMDGGDRQREKTDWVKAEVKRRAVVRREKRYLRTLEQGMSGLEVTNSDSDVVVTHDPATASATAPTPAPASVSMSMSMSVPAPAPAPAAAVPGTQPPGVGSDRGMPSRTSTSTGGGATPQSSGSASELSWPVDVPQQQTPASSVSSPHSQSSESDGVRSKEERELQFVMIYLDHVFPFLFPFYRPLMLESGRGWLLVTLTRSKPLYHTALSLASYFFSVVLNHAADGAHDSCKALNWTELQNQQDMALRELQHEISEINMRGVQASLLDAARVMESIVQLLTFEVAINNTGNWQIHLDAASILFDQIMMQHGVTTTAISSTGDPHRQQQHQEPSWDTVISQLGNHLPLLLRKRAWNSDQAALRFFTAVLLFFDVLAATTLEQPPRLRMWHQQLLLLNDQSADVNGSANPHDNGYSHGANGHFQTRQNNNAGNISNANSVNNNNPSNGGSSSMFANHAHHNASHDPPSPSSFPHLRLEIILGIQNWIVVTVADIAALAAWKRELREAHSNGGSGNPSAAQELAARATVIEARLRAHLDSYTDANGSELAVGPAEPPWHAAQEPDALLLIEPTTRIGNASLAMTRVWAQAALTYLLVTISGWRDGSGSSSRSSGGCGGSDGSGRNPRAADIRASVTRTLPLLAALPAPSSLRTLVWPFCVTGCLAGPEQEAFFRDLVAAMGPLGEFGTVRDALAIMEHVWQHRASLEANPDAWDLAACFRCLGRPSILL